MGLGRGPRAVGDGVSRGMANAMWPATWRNAINSVDVRLAYELQSKSLRSTLCRLQSTIYSLQSTVHNLLESTIYSPHFGRYCGDRQSTCLPTVYNLQFTVARPRASASTDNRPTIDTQASSSRPRNHQQSANNRGIDRHSTNNRPTIGRQATQESTKIRSNID